MDEQRMRVLLIEDNRADALLIRTMLSEAPGDALDLEWVERLAAGLQRCAEGGIQVALLDLSLPDSQGLETLARLRVHAPDVPIVVLTGLEDEALGLKALQEGAQDYLAKGQVGSALLARSLRYAVERKRAEEERAQLIREQAARAEAEAARQRLAFLAEASAMLASSLEYETTLHRVARLVVPSLADYCVIDLVEQDGQVRRVEVAHVDPTREQLLLEELRSYQPGSGSNSPVARVLRSGEPELFPDIPDWLVEAAAQDAAHAELVRALGARSAIIVPLIARGHTLGAITFTAAESGRRYGPSELALAVDLAHRCALAIDNAHLYRQLEQNLRTRDDFLASASHDLKTPLTTIKGYAQLVQRQVARAGLPDASRLIEGLEKIDAATTRMAILIDELLDVARLQMGQPLPLDRHATDLVALARQAAAEHEHTTERHQLRVEAAVVELVGLWDEVRLERVLGNLLDNAIKYSPEGGKVTVCVAQQGPWAVLQVRDQGIGIPAADLPRIFERFQRGGNVIGRIAGTGIGLAGARKIVEQHGGQIAIESQEGVGTIVTVRLPLALEPAGSRQ